MTKKLTDILKRQPATKTTNLGEISKGRYEPHARENFTKAFLRKLTINDHGEPYENDFLGGVKQFDRSAHRFGHDNVAYNAFDNRGGLKDPNVDEPNIGEELNQEDIEMLGEVLDAYFEENPDASYAQAYKDIMEELELLKEVRNPRGDNGVYGRSIKDK